MKEYVIMDTEFNSNSNRAIQISAVRIQDGLHIADQFNRFIPSPDKFDQLHIIRTSNMRYSDYLALPSLQQTVRDYVAWMRTTTDIVGWSIEGDAGRIRETFKQGSHGIPKNWKFIDIADIVEKQYSFNATPPLQGLANVLGIPANRAHNALDDCLRTFGVIKELESRDGKLF
ncbi:exonuclease domain-containing protein [Lacticaseibacillus paracasei]|uniref:exonuclease domain-containing protein n=1 Tax=Lacticaseibacillus paracasei TaxID=1597 RepID=UPI002FFAD4B3